VMSGGRKKGYAKPCDALGDRVNVPRPKRKSPESREKKDRRRRGNRNVPTERLGYNRGLPPVKRKTPHLIVVPEPPRVYREEALHCHRSIPRISKKKIALGKKDGLPKIRRPPCSRAVVQKIRRLASEIPRKLWGTI